MDSQLHSGQLNLMTRRWFMRLLGLLWVPILLPRMRRILPAPATAGRVLPYSLPYSLGGESAADEAPLYRVFLPLVRGDGTD